LVGSYPGLRQSIARRGDQNIANLDFSVAIALNIHHVSF